MTTAILWHRACEILRLRDEDRAKGWPDAFNIEQIARLHYPDDKKMERALLSLMKAAVADGALESNEAEHVVTMALYLPPEKAEFHNMMEIYAGTHQFVEAGTKTFGHDVPTVTKGSYERWQDRPPLPEDSPLRGWIAERVSDSRQMGIYRNRKSLSLFEAACLAHGEDPEVAFNHAWDSIAPDVRGEITSPQEPAALVESMRGLLLGEVGQTWGELMKAFGVSGNAQQPIADIQDALSMMGMVLPFEVRETSGGPCVGAAGKPSSEARIIPYKRPERIKDDWTEVLIAVIEDHEAEHGETGTGTQIWSRIASHPPKGYRYEWDDAQKGYRMPDNPPLTRERFRARFNRLYPDVRPAKAR